MSGVEFQIVDAPRVDATPSGGERSAITIAVVALAAGAGLGTLLVLVATLVGARRPVAAAAERVKAGEVSGGAAARTGSLGGRGTALPADGHRRAEATSSTGR